jgi:hypothetical protein
MNFNNKHSAQFKSTLTLCTTSTDDEEINIGENNLYFNSGLNNLNRVGKLDEPIGVGNISNGIDDNSDAIGDGSYDVGDGSYEICEGSGGNKELPSYPQYRCKVCRNYFHKSYMWLGKCLHCIAKGHMCSDRILLEN